MQLTSAGQIGSFKYSDSPGFTYAVRYNYTVDLNGDGLDELIFAGFETQPNSPAAIRSSWMAVLMVFRGQRSRTSSSVRTRPRSGAGSLG